MVIFNSSVKYNKASVSEEKWSSIISSRKENFNFALENITFNDYNLIVDNKNSILYYSVNDNSSNKYNPNINFKTTENNSKLAILSDEITEEKIANNYEFKVMIYNNSEYHIYNLICTTLPLLNINYDTKLGNKNIPIELDVLFRRVILHHGSATDNELEI